MVFLTGTLSGSLSSRGHALATAHATTATAGEAPRWQQARATTATATATVGEAPRWRRTSTAATGGEGKGNCGSGGSGDCGGENDKKDDGGGDNDYDGSDGNDNGASDNDNDGSDDNDNGGNRGNGVGGCNTAKVVGIDKEDNNQLEVAIDNGCGWPRGGGRVLAGAHGFHATSL